MDQLSVARRLAATGILLYRIVLVWGIAGGSFIIQASHPPLYQVVVQIVPERFQNKAKGRSLQVSMSTFNAVMEPLGGELNRYPPFLLSNSCSWMLMILSTA